MDVYEGGGSAGGSGLGEAGSGSARDVLIGPFDALIEQLDRLRVALEEVAGAFDRLLIGVNTQAQQPALAGMRQATPAAPATPDAIDQSVLGPERERLTLNQDTLDLIEEQNEAIKDATDIQEETASETADIWSLFSDDMLGNFGELFSKVLGDGEVGFGDLWNTVGKGFVDMVKGIDPDSTFAPVLDGIGGLVDGIINGSTADIASGAGGLLDGVLGMFGGSGGGGQDFLSGLGGVFNQFLGEGGGFMSGLSGIFGEGGSFASMLGGAGGAAGGLSAAAGPIGAIAAIAIPIITNMFKDEDFPWTRTDVRIVNGRAVVGESHALDGGDLSGVRDMAKSIVDVINDIVIALGGTLDDEEGLNKSLVGYSSGRSSGLPEGFFVGGDGSFGGGAQYVGIEDEDMASAFAVRAFLDRALEEGTLRGVSEETQDTLRDTLDYADYTDLKSFNEDLDFLVTFDDFVASLQDVTTALDRQVIEIEAAAKERADKERKYIRDFLEKANRFFGEDRESSVDDYRQDPILDPSDPDAAVVPPSIDDLPADIVTHDGLVKLISADESYEGGIPNNIETFENSDTDFGGWVIDGKRFVFSEDQGTDPVLRSEDGEDKIDLVRREDSYYISGDDAFPVDDTVDELGAIDPGSDIRAENLTEAETAMRNYATSLIEQVGGFEDASGKLQGLALKAKEGETGIRELAAVLEEAGFTAEEASKQIEDGVDQMFASLREEFDQNLDEALDPQKAQLRAADENKERLIAEATALSEGDAELLENYLERIEQIYKNDVEEAGYTLNDDGTTEKVYTNLDAILDPSISAVEDAEDYRDTLLAEAADKNGGTVAEEDLEKINKIFENAIESVGYELDESGNAVRTFRDAIDQAVASLDKQIAEQESIRDESQRVVDGLREVRRSIRADANLSTLSPMERLQEARERFETLSVQANDADEEVASEAREDLGSAGREYLELARQAFGSSDQYAEAYNRVDTVLGDTLSTAERELDQAEKQLSVLEEIRDKIAPPEDDPLALPENFNCGKRPEATKAIYTALKAAGLETPTGFGNGQLVALRQSNEDVDRLVTAMGYASGGVMSAYGPLMPETRSSGGIAYEPRLAVFGEGRLPEAFVPLPDGRTIPVTLDMPANDHLRDRMNALRLEVSATVEPGQDAIHRESRAADDLRGLLTGAHDAQDAQADALQRVDGTLDETLSAARQDLGQSLRQIGILEEIRESVSKEADPLAPPEGFDLGRRPQITEAIYRALKAAGLETPSGFGSGQLTALRQRNESVDLLVRAMGYDRGGVMTEFGPLRPEPGSSGGVTHAPRLAIFGEGRLPEAYVPLPDGRTIPVTVDWPANDRQHSEQRGRDHSVQNAALIAEVRKLRAEMSGARQDNERIHRNLSRFLSGSVALGR